MQKVNILTIKELTFRLLRKTPITQEFKSQWVQALENFTHWLPQIFHGGYSMVKPLSTHCLACCQVSSFFIEMTEEENR